MIFNLEFVSHVVGLLVIVMLIVEYSVQRYSLEGSVLLEYDAASVVIS
jgi:hypothetical protein